MTILRLWYLISIRCGLKVFSWIACFTSWSEVEVKTLLGCSKVSETYLLCTPCLAHVLVIVDLDSFNGETFLFLKSLNVQGSFRSSDMSVYCVKLSEVLLKIPWYLNLETETFKYFCHLSMSSLFVFCLYFVKPSVILWVLQYAFCL